MRDKQIEGEWQDFLNFALKFKNKAELEEFFSLFLTLEEQRDLLNRYFIIRELLTGEKTQREIAKDLKVSIAKITRGSNFLKTFPEEFHKRIKKKIR